MTVRRVDGDGPPGPGPVSGRRRRAQPRPRTRAAGYTLIEVVVAFAVLGLALMLLLGTLSNGARQVRWSADAGRATLHARSLLDDVGIAIPVETGTTRGTFDDGRYRWALAIAPYEDPDAAPTLIDPGAARLFALTLDVDWGAAGPRERLRLRTLRLRASDPLGAALP